MPVKKSKRCPRRTLSKARKKIELQREAAFKVASIFRNCVFGAAVDKHPQLVKNGVKSCSIGLYGGALAIPLRDINGHLWSFQFIERNGYVHNMRDGRKKGCFYTIGTIKKGAPLIITEGFIRAAELHQHSDGCTVVAALDAHNLEPVTADIRRCFPKLEIIIIAGSSALGRRNAEIVAKKYGCITPP